MIRLSYWVAPILAGTVWLAMLLAMLLYWIINEHAARYPFMAANQQIAYISDVGASPIKPLFIAGCVITSVLLDLSFAADRWLRHKGRLAPNTTAAEKVLSGLTMAFAVVGTVGLVLLSVFDTDRYKREHDVFLLLFIAGYVLSAIFICWEYQQLGMRHREQRILRLSFYIKLTFVVIEVLLAIAFVACTFTSHYNAGAVLEWVIALIFSAYIFSFYVDLYPAARTKQQHLQASANGAAGGLKMRPARGGRAADGDREKERSQPGREERYDAAREMEQGTAAAPNGGAVASLEDARGRRSGSRSRAMAGDS